MAFPKDFLWGSATASYQIEGGGLGEGRGECIWYRFSHTPGKIKNDDNGDVACDHIHRYREDVQLMKSLGLQAYRFSISWPRVLPQGIGSTNPQGLDFYDRLVDELLKFNIRPFVTLYHWDLPQALQDRGGWANPDSINWFAAYTDLMSRRLGDRVKDWITHNEPWVVAILGNFWGIHAPGLNDPATAYQVAHHVLRSHGAAVPVIRRNVIGARVGITLNLAPVYPVSSSEEDKGTGRRFDGFFNRWYLDPVFRGEYPADMVELGTPFLNGIDLAAVRDACAPLDFLGVNYYTRMIVKHKPDSPPFDGDLVRPESAEFTAMDWEVYPQGLTDLLVRVHKDYAPPAIYITENGAAYDDPVPNGGAVPDPRRVAYLDVHFKALEAAIAQGVPLKGYFLWSLMDNFEWAEGYSKRFGMVYVDFATQQRTPKESARFYQRTIMASRNS